MNADTRAAAPGFTGGMSRAAAQAQLRRSLAVAGIDSATLDSRILVAFAIGIGQTSLLAHSDEVLSLREAARLQEAAIRRLAREPVARIIGEAEFWGLPFRLSPDTLAPRPDTESIVEAALGIAATAREPLQILDLGTGTGCILVALLSELRNAFGIAIDRSAGALAIAKRNAEMNGVAHRAAFVASDWASALGGRFGLVVSNPPYIRASEIPALAPEVSRFDPLAALDGGDDGLDAYRAILQDAGRFLAPDGHVVLELGHDQADRVGALAKAQGFLVETIRPDLAGHRRALVLRPRPDLDFGG